MNFGYPWIIRGSNGHLFCSTKVACDPYSLSDAPWIREAERVPDVLLDRRLYTISNPSANTIGSQDVHFYIQLELQSCKWLAAETTIIQIVCCCAPLRMAASNHGCYVCDVKRAHTIPNNTVLEGSSPRARASHIFFIFIVAATSSVG